MPRRIVDISVALKAGIVSDPPYMLPQISYVDHAAGAVNFMQVFGVRKDQLPDGAGPAVENVAISTHNGTHLDAPYHFHPTMDNGKPAMTIDQVPLEWCFNDAVKLDFRQKADGYVCTADDVKRELDRLKYQLKPLDIVLANTPAGITGLNSLGIPVIAVLASAIQLGERPPAMELVGMVMIGVALGLLAWLGLRRDQMAQRTLAAER